jgi:signal peptidase I
MFDKWIQYSYAAKKRERHRILRIFCILLALYLFYNMVNTLFCSVWVLQNDSMKPGLQRGDRLLVVSSLVPAFVSGLLGRGEPVPFKRGQVVLVDSSRSEKIDILNWAADAAVRFCTAQQLSLLGSGGRFHLKRLAGLPGDEISMTNYVLRVRPAGQSYTLTEFELAVKPYYPVIPQSPALWDESLPFSGDMERFTLGDNECFVISDDRLYTADSRGWGPLTGRAVAGRAVFRFWPLTRIGRL